MMFILRDCRCGSGKKYAYGLNGKSYCEACKPESAERLYGDVEITFTESGNIEWK